MERCIETANASGTWTPEALARAYYRLAEVYEAQEKNLETAAEYRRRALETLEKYDKYCSSWVLEMGDKLLELDDLQPTDEGRYIRRSLMQELWKRRKELEDGQQ